MKKTIRNRLRRLSPLPLLCALLLSLAACGQSPSGGSAFRTLRVIGARQYSVICRKGDQLAPRVNAAMNVLAANGTLTALSNAWLGRSVITLDGDAGALDALPPETPAPTPTPDPDALEGETPPAPVHRTLIFGVEADFRPLSYLDNGTFSGLTVEIAQRVGETLDWPIAFQPISASEVAAQLASGNIDCAIGFDASLLSSEKFDIGVSYMESEIVLAVRSESEVRRLKDLQDQRIGTVDDPGVIAAVKADEKIVKYASGATVYLSPERCISALDNGWCAAVAIDELRLDYRAG